MVLVELIGIGMTDWSAKGTLAYSAFQWASMVSFDSSFEKMKFLVFKSKNVMRMQTYLAGRRSLGYQRRKTEDEKDPSGHRQRYLG